MKHIPRIPCSLIGLIFIIGFSTCYAQEDPRLSEPVVSYGDGEVTITYDIQSRNSDDQFTVWVVIKDLNGRSINARSLVGDVGESVEIGKNKTITWNPDADGIILGEGIAIQVFAELEDTRDEISPTVKSTETDQVKMGSVVAQSLLLPGLGLSRVTGQPHWIRGVAGYLAIGSAVALHFSAKNNYDLYMDENDRSTRDELFDKAVMQDNVSEILAFSAVAIWAGDIIWNIIGVSKLKSSYAVHDKGFSVKPVYDPISQIPVLAFTYRF
jgi:hypothetical protein